MRIFISWSGPRSKKVADYLKDWLLNLPLPIEPWVSGDAIEPGTRWSKELSAALEGTDFGILCLTPDNQLEPWICFEGGALSKFGKARVVPYLLGMKPSELKHPLQQFHAVEGHCAGTWKMVHGIHKATEDQTRSEKNIRQVFDKWWPDLEKVIQDAVNEVQTPEPKEPDLREFQASLERIGAVIESLSSRFNQLEQRITSGVRADLLAIRDEFKGGILEAVGRVLESLAKAELEKAELAAEFEKAEFEKAELEKARKAKAELEKARKAKAELEKARKAEPPHEDPPDDDDYDDDEYDDDPPDDDYPDGDPPDEGPPNDDDSDI